LSHSLYSRVNSALIKPTLEQITTYEDLARYASRDVSVVLESRDRSQVLFTLLAPGVVGRSATSIVTNASFLATAMSAPAIIWNTVIRSAQLSTVLQILLYLPLTLAVLGQPAFLANSLLLFLHSLLHGTMVFFSSHSPILSVLQPPVHPFLLLLSFNIYSTTQVNPWMTSAADWWGWILRLSSPTFIIMEGLSSLLVAQKLGQDAKFLISEGREEYQFGFLVATAIAYVASGVWIAQSYSAVATSPLSSTLLGVAITAFVFVSYSPYSRSCVTHSSVQLTFIGFALRRTNVIESSGLALFLAYNVWLCGFDQKSFSDPASS
jgi:hypothetical protein